MAIERFYKQTIEVWRGTPATDDRGNTTMGTRTKQSEFPGTVNRHGTKEERSGGQWIYKDTYKLFCATTRDIQEHDQIREGSNKYRVIGQPKDTIVRGNHFNINLEKWGKDND